MNHYLIILVLTTIILISLKLVTASTTKINELLTKLENYYNSNNSTEFQKILELTTKYAIDNNQNNLFIEFLKNKIINKGYQNPFINEKIADSLFDLGDLQSSKNLYYEIIKYLNPNSNLSSSTISRIYNKIAQIDLLEGSINKYLENLNKSYLYEVDIENKINLKIQAIKDEINYLNIDTNKVTNEIYNLLSEIVKIPADKKEKTYITLTEIYDLIGLKEESQKILQSLISKSNSLDSLIAQFLFTEDKTKQKEILEKIVNQYQQVDPYYLEKLGDIYLNEGELEKAKNLLTQVINQIPTKHFTLYKLAQIYYKQDNITSAQKYIDSALKQSENPEYLELAGDIYQKIDKNKSLEFYQKAYDLYTDISSKAKVRKKISELKNNN
ncbi:MAG: tetratricopeptide repeat protein [Candidatus Calescibacterium sp.]|nr:tetratricopeptide repeat protein [Candidatus Calescibacterium sp.]